MCPATYEDSLDHVPTSDEINDSFKLHDGQMQALQVEVRRLTAQLDGMGDKFNAQLANYVTKLELSSKLSVERGERVRQHEQNRVIATMALLRTLHGELAAAQGPYVEYLLLAKRQVTGSGTAALVLSVVEVSLMIAAAACTFGGAGVAAAGLTAAAATTGSARDNDARGTLGNVASGAVSIAAAKKAEEDSAAKHKTADEWERGNITRKSLADNIRPGDPSEVDHAKTAVDSSQAIGAAIHNNFKALKKFSDDLHKAWDWDTLKPKLGTGRYEIDKKRRRATGFVHHGQGGTFCIQADFATAVGIAYGELLQGLQKLRPGSALTKLLDAANLEAQSAPFANPSLLTRYVLYKGLQEYQSNFGQGSYAALMQAKKGGMFSGYSGSQASAKVKSTIGQVSSRVNSNQTTGSDVTTLFALTDTKGLEKLIQSK